MSLFACLQICFYHFDRDGCIHELMMAGLAQVDGSKGAADAIGTNVSVWYNLIDQDLTVGGRWSFGLEIDNWKADPLPHRKVMGTSHSFVHYANACLLTIASNVRLFIPMPARAFLPHISHCNTGQAMGNDVHRNPGKRHYDITMSRRTRKPLNLQESKKEIPANGDVVHGEEKRNSEETRGGGDHHDNDQKKSLKQLIHGDGNLKVIQPEDEGNKCRSSLEQHFTEEKLQLQLVVKQQEEVVAAGVKPAAAAKGSPVSHYIKFLSHLIKAKHDNSRAASRRKAIIALPTHVKP